MKRIFKPCRQFIYSVKYWDKEFNLISDEKVWMMATGRLWDSDENQREVVFQYNYDEIHVDRIHSHSLNPAFNEGEWTRKSDTGVIEDEYFIFMHPFRRNQYSFLEVVPFPEVLLPLTVGKQWNRILNIHEFGDWGDSKVENAYEVLSFEEQDSTLIGVMETWHIRATAYAKFGNSHIDYWFNEDVGFVKMIVKNYAEQLLMIQLEEVVEG